MRDPPRNKLLRECLVRHSHRSATYWMALKIHYTTRYKFCQVEILHKFLLSGIPKFVQNDEIDDSRCGDVSAQCSPFIISRFGNFVNTFFKKNPEKNAQKYLKLKRIICTERRKKFCTKCTITSFRICAICY